MSQAPEKLPDWDDYYMGIAFAVRAMQIEFEGAAHIDDLLEVTTKIETMSGARLVLAQTILRDGMVLTRAMVTVVAIKTTGGVARLPRALIERFGAPK